MSASSRRGSARLLAPAIACLAFLAVAVSPSEAEAHAYLIASIPAAGSTLASAPTAVTLTFSETPEPQLSLIEVLDQAGIDQVTGPIAVAAAPPSTISVPLGELPDGVYEVSWRAVSAVDGHVSAGSFDFGVGTSPPSAGPFGSPIAGQSESGSLASTVARWLLYLGIVALFGTASVALAVARIPPRDLLLVAAGGWILTFVGTVAVVAAQWIEIGAPVETLIGTALGVTALARGISIVLVGVSVVALAAVPSFAGVRGWAAVAGSAGVALVVDVLSGHAAAGPGAPLQVVAQVTHGLAAAVLVGGLLGLLLSIRAVPGGERVAVVRRYSSWAGVALVVVAVTGAARAAAEIGTVDALVNTDFGRVVIAKSVLLIALAGLGAFNRFVTLGDAAGLVGRIRRVGTAELLIAVVILGVSGLLVNLSPPALAGGSAEPVAQSVTTGGSAPATDVGARLVVTPGGTDQALPAARGPGHSRLHVTIEVTP